VIVCVVLAAVVWWGLPKSSDYGLGAVQHLSDGTTLEIRQIAFTPTNFTFNYRGGGRLARIVAPLLPRKLAGRFWPQTGSVGFGTDGSSNLFVITAHGSGAPGWWSDLRRLIVFDDQGNLFDACFGASTIGFPGEVMHGWQVRSFPRRTRMLGLRFISETQGNRWVNAAELKIRNPAYAIYPQWQAEFWPVTKADGDLSVTLSQFQSGVTQPPGGFRLGAELSPRATRMVFGFAQKGRPADNWRVQKLVISDATGNHWSPWLDSSDLGSSGATNGTVEFLGALWPGESAWKLAVEVVRSGEFGPEELWEAPPISLPGPGLLTDLTNSWAHDGVMVRLAGLSSPNTDHPGEFKWIAKWWGDDKNKVYALALKLSSEWKGHRLTVARVRDQDDREVEVVQHANQDYAEQALFLKPAESARELKLTLALQRSRFVQFLARPEFVGLGTTNSPARPPGN
jgi:hypothetical protein